MAAASALAVLTDEPTFASSVAAASIIGVVVITKDMAAPLRRTRLLLRRYESDRWRVMTTTRHLPRTAR
ncbi:hypothetical protein MCNS_26670 [Mycobacterium conspicuum]|uniref:Uncharacterized protein n=1 Tax=Mycobacterium conspicuum TaxID=44010 RepID=A0A7I7YEE2_9MYCO|nr:hypothetical protein MCNS_26670 [Mycobacterium conspicuum]